MPNLRQLVALGLILMAGQVCAHHGTFYRTLFKAVETKTFERMESWFTESAWTGGSGSLAGSEIQLRLQTAKDISVLREYSSHSRPGEKAKKRCVVLFRLVEGNESIASWIYLLAEHPGARNAGGGIDASQWRVVRIVDNLSEARQFIRREFFGDISSVCPTYEAEQGSSDTLTIPPDSKPETKSKPQPEPEGAPGSGGRLRKLP